MRQKINLLVTFSIVSVISYYSLRPIGGSPGAGPAINFTLLHFLAYFALAGAFLLHFHDNKIGHLYAALASFLFGLGMEIVQTQIPSRFFTYQDIAVNLAGSSLVMLDHRSRFVTDFIEIEDRILERVEKGVTGF